MTACSKSDGLFQSHAGSIEANYDLSNDVDAIRFQSHAGSIEARISTAPTCAVMVGFNPTLVRLRQRNLYLRRRDKKSFNPTLVRLRRRNPRAPAPESSCFNPTLVRLRPPEPSPGAFG